MDVPRPLVKHESLHREAAEQTTGHSSNHDQPLPETRCPDHIPPHSRPRYRPRPVESSRRFRKHQQALPSWQQRRNALIAPRRALVEKVFGTLKRSYGYQRVRYRGLGRNTVELWFKLMAYNLRKADTLAWAAG